MHEKTYEYRASVGRPGSLAAQDSTGRDHENARLYPRTDRTGSAARRGRPAVRKFYRCARGDLRVPVVLMVRRPARPAATRTGLCSLAQPRCWPTAEDQGDLLAVRVGEDATRSAQIARRTTMPTRPIERSVRQEGLEESYESPLTMRAADVDRPQRIMARSSIGAGYRFFTAGRWVRLPYGLLTIETNPGCRVAANPRVLGTRHRRFESDHPDFTVFEIIHVGSRGLVAPTRLIARSR